MAAVRPRGLLVLSSSNQLYSGSGSYIFRWLRVAQSSIDFTVAIDTGDARNTALAAQFCCDLGLRFIPASPHLVGGCPDYGVRDVARLCASEHWDFIECISWANGATNGEVLASIPSDTYLIYTPFIQPMSTLSEPANFYMVKPVLEAMLDRADLIFVVAPNELDGFEGLSVPTNLRERMVWICLGVDSGTFCPSEGPANRSLLSVCDFREPRKRADLLLTAFAEAARHDPSLELVIIGDASDRLKTPTPINDRVRRLGYVDIKQLVLEYQQCGVFVLLSDYEAFGLPIAEALSCGTPVIINRQPQLEAIFGSLQGVSFVRNTDTAEVTRAILEALSRPIDRSDIARAASARFAFDATYGRKLDHVLSRLSGSPRVNVAPLPEYAKRKCLRQ